MKASYLVRLDDACPTMASRTWERIEQLLDKHNIRPIVGVIPDNKDRTLFIEKPDAGYWAKIRDWAKKGWAIGLHGCDHLSGADGNALLPINRCSEFAGLSLQEQREKIRHGLEILRNADIFPSLWIAPLHTFDMNTLKALLLETKIRTISDGVSVFPYRRYGFNWIPQQLWKFRTMPFGVWTICLHPNTMAEEDIKKFEKSLVMHADSFVSVDGVEYRNRRTLLDLAFTKWFFIQLKKKRRHLKISM